MNLAPSRFASLAALMRAFRAWTQPAPVCLWIPFHWGNSPVKTPLGMVFWKSVAVSRGMSFGLIGSVFFMWAIAAGLEAAMMIPVGW